MKTPVVIPGELDDVVEFPESPENNYFVTKTFGEWYTHAKTKPRQNELVSNLIFENELIIIFGGTNVGKSLVGVQIALHIAGVSVFNPFDKIVNPRKVLYCDFELQDFQFVKRLVDDNYFSQYKDLLNNENIVRAEINDNYEFTDTQLTQKTAYSELLFNQLENTIINDKINVVLFDNITFLADELESSKNASPLIKRFKEIGRRHKVTFIIFGHTPKIDPKLPINKYSLAGSSQFANIVDTLIGVGQSIKDNHTVYLKVLKQRSKDIEYTANNVIKFNIDKHPERIPTVQFDFIGYGEESELLKEDTKAEKEARDKQILELLNEKMTYNEIAQILGVSKALITKVKKNSEKLAKNVNT